MKFKLFLSYLSLRTMNGICIFPWTKPKMNFSNKHVLWTLKSNFILQPGYFKARHIFFNFEFGAVQEDVERVLHLYFPGQKINFGQTVAKNTRLKQQQFILNSDITQRNINDVISIIY